MLTIKRLLRRLKDLTYFESYKPICQVGPVLLGEGYEAGYRWMLERTMHIPWEQGRAREARFASGSYQLSYISYVTIAAIIFIIYL